MLRPEASLRSSLLLFLVATSPGRAQTPPEPAVAVNQAVLAGPAWLSGTASGDGIWLRFSPVTDAVSYRVTRIDKRSDAEVQIYAGLPGTFTLEGYNCTVGSPAAVCVFLDKHPLPATTHTYRVWAVYVTPEGQVVSPPSPAIMVHWK